jgi:hypothetical protein
MAHKIMEFDIQQGRSQAWHGLTQEKPLLRLSDPDLFLRQWNPELGDCVIKMADGTIIEHSAASDETDEQGNENEKKGSHFQLPLVISCEHDAEISPINPVIVGKPFAPGSYTFIDNVRFIKLIEDSLKEAGIEMDVESCGSVFNRSRTFVSIPLPGLKEQKLGDREFKFYLNFINSFDMSTPLMANVSNICTVCNNTLTFNLDAGGFLVRHTKNAIEKLDALPDVIALAVQTQREFANDFLKLASAACDEDTAEAFFAGFLAAESAEKLTLNTKNRVDRLVKLFRKGAGNNGKNWADVLSAGTDFFTHEAASGRGDENAKWKNELSSAWGAGARQKERMFSLLRAPVPSVGKKLPRNSVAEKGRELLKAS